MKLFSNLGSSILKLIFGLIMVAVVVVVGFGIYFFFELGARPSNSPDNVPFTVKYGETFSDVTQNLYTKSLIRNTFVFRLRAKMLGAEDRVVAGDFYLRRNMTVDEVLETVTSARLVERRVTIPEGLRLEEIAQRFADKGWNKDKFIQLVQKGDYQFGFLNDKPAGASVEGFLFPDTYSVAAGMSEDDIIIMMLRRFGEQYNSKLREKAQQGLGIYRVVTLASIIEREAVKADERPIIASVFYNRLNINMQLETDPTVQWARDTAQYKKDPNFNKWWKAPTKEDLKVDSPYNTYKVKGLPPGPISNPGLASLQAATEPFTTEYFYFVATGDREGSHAFAKTVEEHNENVKKYLS